MAYPYYANGGGGGIKDKDEAVSININCWRNTSSSSTSSSSWRVSGVCKKLKLLPVVEVVEHVLLLLLEGLL
jgi:hypothetical protein